MSSDRENFEKSAFYAPTRCTAQGSTVLEATCHICLRNPSEAIIIDFQHLYNVETKFEMQAFAKLVEEVLGSRVFEQPS